MYVHKRRSLGSLLFLAFALFLCSSCGRQYTTSIPAEPLFTSHPKNMSYLGQEGEEYVKRDNLTFAATGGYQPKETESFEDYQTRLFNTLYLQEQEKQHQQKAIVNKESLLLDLQNQLQILQKRHIDLRLALVAQMPEQNKHAIADALFTCYTIQAGDTLQKIAYNQMSSNRAWLGIYRFNNNRMPNGPNRIRPGDRVIIPKIDNEKSVRLHEKRRSQD